MKKTTPLLHLVLLGLVLPALAAPAATPPERVPGQHPRPGIGDPRIRNLTYMEGAVYTITTHYFIATAIYFGADETLLPLPVIGGDPLAWDIHFIGPNAISIKPIARSPDTNMIVHTDKRLYYFHLTVAPAHSMTEAVYGVHFTYPLEQIAHDRARQQAIERAKPDPNQSLIRRQQEILRNSIALNNIYTGYTLRGNKAIKPNTVFDDGRFTYLRFDPHTPIPAIYAKDSTGEILINHHARQNYLIVQRLSNVFILRFNRAKLKITRNRPVGSIRNNEPVPHTPIVEQSPYTAPPATTGIGQIIPRPAMSRQQQEMEAHTRTMIETDVVKHLPPTPYVSGPPEPEIVTPASRLQARRENLQQDPLADMMPSDRTPARHDTPPLTDAFIRFTGAAPDMPCPGGKWIDTPDPDQPGQSRFVLQCP